MFLFKHFKRNGLSGCCHLVSTTYGQGNILGGILSEDERLRGRFAFLMERRWGDLRLLIDHRMKTRRSTNGPFSIDHATHLMLTIGKNMDILHTKHDIVHMDLKAFNVLVQKKFSHEGMIQDALDVLVQKRKHSYGDMF